MSSTRSRRKRDPEIVIARDTDSELSSSEEEEEEEDNYPFSESEEEDEAVKNGGKIELEKNKAKGKAPITVKLIKKVCKVCKQPGHEAGFKGATYIDCPMKPCFLCKMPGHTTMSCPHRVVTDHGILPTSHRNTKNPIDFVFKRQLQPRIPPIKPKYVIPDQVHCAVIRYHSRRVTCLEFHPTKNNILLSGDKKGQIGVWDFGKVYEKNVYGNIHSVQVNNMRFSPTNDDMVYSASSDGTIGYTDLETGTSSTLLNLNPDGWQGANSWKMLYGMDINSEKGVVLAADNFGFLHMIDHRTNNSTGEPILIHKQGSKVCGLDCNPVQPELLLSCGNDHFARIWDMRKLQPKASLHDLAHKRVVNSAYFSPSSGTKILTTCQDNRIRIWDSIFGNLDLPSREIVHSNDFNRHLTPFKAEWDPKDTSESLIVIGRYISENYNGTALHPIDFIDASNGQLVAEVMDPNITTITPVNKLHPRDDVLASGSSRSLFIWRPQDNTEMVEEKKDKKIIICYGDSKKKGKKQKRGSDDEDDEDDIFSSKGTKTNTMGHLKSLFTILFLIAMSSTVTFAGKIPAIIVFGDSSVDAGNNNYIPTVARSNFEPYGRDFVGGKPTGRFCNGKIATDFMSEALGLKPIIPAYLDPSYNISDFATGVTFASAATGYDNATSDVLSVLPLWKQLEYYKEYQTKLKAYQGKDRGTETIESSLYLISIGTNDFLENYFAFPGRSSQYSVSLYQDFLAGIAKEFVKKLHGLGARKISLGGLPPMGCMPLERATNIGTGGECVGRYNDIAVQFNSKLDKMVEKLSKELPGSNLVFSNPYEPFMRIIKNPSSFGFEVVGAACCATGMFEMGYGCQRNNPFTCTNADKYVFWDSFHPTQKTNHIMANALMNSTFPHFL